MSTHCLYTRPLYLLSLLTTLLCSPALAGGMATYDATAVLQLQQQFRQLQEQYLMLKNQYNAMTGSYNRGQTGLNQAISSSAVVPGSWQDVVNQQKNGAYASKQSVYEKQLKTMPEDQFLMPQSQNAKTYRMSSDSVRGAMAAGDSLYSQVQVHLNNLALLAQQVDTTTNMKDAQDLQNRISTENGLLQTAMAKVNAINMNLQANLLNQQNQATAANQQFFRWRSSKGTP